MIENISFANPGFFFLLLLIPLLIFHEKYIRKYPAIKFSSVPLIRKAYIGKILNPAFLLLFLRILVIILFIFALARPQIGRASSEVLTSGINIILGIDTSESMRAIDLEINNDRTTRLEVVKKVVTEFIKKRSNDPTGLIVFGTEAFTQCPLTLDYQIMGNFIENLEIGMAGPNTALGDAIGLAVKRLKDLPAKSKILILLTDGKNTAGKLSPEKAADISAHFKIKIYTIGVGSSGRIPFLQDSFLGPQIVYSQADLDEQTLKMIASKTGGNYYRAKNADELEKIYSDIDKLEKSDIKIKKFMEYSELFHYFMICGLIILLFEVILENTRYIKIP